MSRRTRKIRQTLVHSTTDYLVLKILQQISTQEHSFYQQSINETLLHTDIATAAGGCIAIILIW